MDSSGEVGFSLVEVMAAALIMTLLVVNLLALVVYAGMFRIKAQQSSKARNWIQQDLETVKFKASQFQFASLSPTTATFAAGASSITVNQISIGSISLVPGDSIKIGTDSTPHTISGISSPTLSFSPPLGTSQSSSAPVWVSGGASTAPKLCNAASGSTGLAQALASSLDPVVTSTQPIAGVSYTLNRVTTPSATAPYQMLTVAYSVAPTSGGTPILSLQTQVMPYAAFGCPS